MKKIFITIGIVALVTVIYFMVNISKNEKTEKKNDSEDNVVMREDNVVLHDYTVIEIKNMNINNEDFEIEYNDDKTRVRSISGKYSDISVNNSEDALNAVQDIHTIVGLSNPHEELELFYNNSDKYGSVYKFNQVFKGYEVYDHRLVVVTNEDNITDYFESDIVPTSLLNEMNLEVMLSQKDAENKVQNFFQDSYDIKSGKTELIIYTFDDYEKKPILAYKMEEDESTFFIDAYNGEIIDIISNEPGMITYDIVKIYRCRG